MDEGERRRMSGFASFVAHELRNPLAVAKARMELALRGADLDDRFANHARRGLASVDAAIAILDRLELYSRADAGRIEARREAFDLGAALAAALEQLRARGSERQIEVVAPEHVSALGDRELAEQAIANLLSNAERYSRPGAPIKVTLSAGDAATLRVVDAGPGISDEVAELIFHAPVSFGRGLGLGLYLANATMAAQGGSVELEQRRPGAVFTLRWPGDPASVS